MVSMKNIKAAQAANYYKSKDDYYSKENQGEWYGKGAELLGLKGPVERETFENILNGKAPDGSDLVRTAPNGEHRAGIDLTFSAPKSVSIMALASNDPELMDKIRNAHDQAVKSTLDFMEKKTSRHGKHMKAIRKK